MKSGFLLASRSSYLLVVSMAVLTMLVVGCGTAQDVPDVEATVVVMLEEEKAKSLPTPLSTEARLGEIKAKTLSTVTPLLQPTPKPLSSTPLLQPTLNPLSSAEILGKASEVMADLESMSYKIDMGMAMGAFELPMSYEGEFHAPDNLSQTLSMNMMGLNIESDIMLVDGVTYEREFMEDDWHESYSFEGVDPREFWTGTESFLAFPITVDPTIEDLDGVEVYKISWDLGQELGNSAGKVLSILDFDDEDMPEDMVLEYWVDANSFHLRKLSIDIKMADFEATEGEATEEEMLAMMLLGGGEIMGITMDFELFNFDQLDQIFLPATAVSATPAPNPAAPASAPTPEPVSVLTYVEMKKDGVGGVDGLDGAKSVTVSPDGNHVYATGWAENAIAVFSRNSSTGKLTYVEMKKNGVGEVRGLDGVKSVTVSLDGKHVYTAAENESAVAVFSRNSSTGALTHVEMKQDGVGGVDGLGGAQSVTVSPDGNHVYAASDYDDAIAVFSRNSSTPTDTSQYPDILTVVDLGTSGYGGSYDINGSYSGQPMWTNFSCGPSGKYEHCHIFLSPDKVVSSTGTWVIQPVTPTDEWNAGGYFDCPGLPWGSCSPGWEFAEITVSKASGEQSLTEALTYVEMKKDGVGGVDGLDGAKLVTVSPDGNHVYAAAENDDAVAVFSRNSSTGALTYVEMKKDGVGGVDGLDGAQSVTVSPDGNHVYATSYNENAIAVFSRNSSTGKLTYVEMKKNGVGEVRGLDEVKSVIVSLDGKHVYTAAENESAIAVFSRNLSTGELTYVEMKQDGVGGVDGLDNALSITVSPDGKHVYSAGQGDDAVAVFSMNSSTSIPTPTPTPTPTPSPTPTPTPSPIPTPTPSPTPTPTPSPEPEYLYVGSTVEGYLAATDKHYWDFLIMEGQRIFVEAETDWGVSLDTYLELWGPEEEGTRVLLASNDNGPLAEVDNSRDPLIDFEILETGTHRVMVGPNPDMPSYSDNGGNYKLSVVVVEDHGYLEMGTPVDEYLLTFEKHYWHFNGVAGQYIVIEAVSGAPGFGAAQLDTYIELHGPGWDGARQLLARNDDGLLFDVSYRYDSIINFEILETGPHTVVMSPPVLENKTDGFGDKTGRQGDYRLSVQEAPE